MTRVPALSGRLLTAAQLVCQASDTLQLLQEERTVADIGCDHALLPLYLLSEHRIGYAIASDSNEKPLARARENANRFGVAHQMRFVKANGLQGVKPGEAKIAVIAGMGGELIRDILTERDASGLGIKRLVLVPHTRAHLLRKWLAERRYRIEAEQMVKDAGKYYPCLLCTSYADKDAGTLYEACESRLQRVAGCQEDEAHRIALRFGPWLLTRPDQVFSAYLEYSGKRLSRIRDQVAGSGNREAKLRADASLREVTYAKMLIREEVGL